MILKTTKASSSKPLRRDGTGAAVWIVRIVFVVCLSCVMIGLGVAALLILRAAEQDLAETQYESVAERALREAAVFTRQRLMATVSIASFVSEMLPYAEPWPFVTVKGFERQATNILETSSGVGSAFAPIVRPDQVDVFEDFVYDFYQNTRKPTFPQGTGTSSFGEGIFAMDQNASSPDKRYHITDGSTSYGSPYDILTPILHHSTGASSFLMNNMHSEEIRGRSIDKMLNCTSNFLMQSNASTVRCAVITDARLMLSTGGPSALIFQPVFPARNRENLTGLIVNHIVWEQLLENLFDKEISGIDCVIEAEGSAFTYKITDGAATYVMKEGDFHEPRYNSLRRCVNVTDDELYFEESPKYSLCLYPNSKLYGSYRTNNPRIAAIGAVSTIVFTSLLFFMYDYFVRRDVTAKKDLLQAKRRFMRFVSHEVRTPLSAVCMGLNVMQSEIASSLGFKSSDDLDDSTHNGKDLRTEARPISTTEALEWYEMAKEVQGNTQNAVNVLNDLLNYDKIESGTLRLELTLVPIWRVIEQTVKEFKLAAERKQLKLETDFGDILKDEESGMFRTLSQRFALSKDVRDNKLVGDSVRVTQVLRNLISNAVKFTPEHGTIYVTTRWIEKEKTEEDTMDTFMLRHGSKESFERSGTLTVSVKDSGAGMTREQLKKLFRAGMQFNVNALQNGKGSGLGLYIAKGIVEQHNGNLAADSEGLGFGSTFTLTLPLHHVPETDVTSTVTDSATDGEMSDGEKPSLIGVDSADPLRILVVDDTPSVRRLLCRLLEKRGRICTQAEDGNQAVERVRESMVSGLIFDAVLMDYEMPEMNGPVAAQIMREMGSDVFIVGITGNLLREDVDYFLSCGANAVLPKPLNISDLEVLLVEHGVANHAP